VLPLDEGQPAAPADRAVQACARRTLLSPELTPGRTESIARKPAACGPARSLTDVDILAGGEVQLLVILERFHDLGNPRTMISILIHGSDCPGRSDDTSAALRWI
jgi:hypothetical protein